MDSTLQELLLWWGDNSNYIIAVMATCIIVLSWVVFVFTWGGSKLRYVATGVAIVAIALGWVYSSPSYTGSEKDYDVWSKRADAYVDSLLTEKVELDSAKLSTSGDSIIVTMKDQEVIEVEGKYIEDDTIDTPYMEYHKLEQPIGDLYDEGYVRVVVHVPKEKPKEGN